MPKTRTDKDQSKLPEALQEAVLQAKRDNPRRSIDTIEHLLQSSGQAAKDELSRSAIHRLLCRRQLVIIVEYQKPASAVSSLGSRPGRARRDVGAPIMPGSAREPQPHAVAG